MASYVTSPLTKAGGGMDLENCAYALEKSRLRPGHEKFNVWPRPKSECMMVEHF